MITRLLVLTALLAGCNTVGHSDNKPNVLITTREVVEASDQPEEETQYPPIPSTLKDLDDAHFDAAIKRGDTVVEFYALWCSACREFAPALNRLKARHPRVHFYRVDIDANPVSVKENEIVMVPTLVMFRGGKRDGSLVGAYPDAVLDRFVEDEI